MPSIDDFKARLTGGGARPNLFKVTLNFPSFASGPVELTSFMAKAASLPASTIGNIDVPYRGRNIRVAGDRTFDEWSITVFNDDAMTIRNALETWSNSINEHINNVGVQAPNDYKVDAKVEQLNRSEEVTKTYTFIGMWPSSVGAIELAYDTNDTIEEFEVTLQYDYWKSNTTS